MYLAQKARNVLRGLLQAHGTVSVKKRLWNHEFANGRWNCLETGIGDCVYPYVEKYGDQGSILDLGCGSGSTANELDDTKYRDYAGIDISEVALDKARQKMAINGRTRLTRFVQGEIYSYIPTGQYDVILFKDSIYYVARGKIASMLNRYSRYLTDRGVIIVKMSGSDKYSTIVDSIEEDFEVVEKSAFDRPQALVVVFRQRSSPGSRVTGGF